MSEGDVYRWSLNKERYFVIMEIDKFAMCLIKYPDGTTSNVTKGTIMTWAKYVSPKEKLELL